MLKTICVTLMCWLVAGCGPADKGDYVSISCDNGYNTPIKYYYMISVNNGVIWVGDERAITHIGTEGEYYKIPYGVTCHKKFHKLKGN